MLRYPKVPKLYNSDGKDRSLHFATYSRDSSPALCVCSHRLTKNYAKTSQSRSRRLLSLNTGIRALEGSINEPTGFLATHGDGSLYRIQRRMPQTNWMGATIKTAWWTHQISSTVVTISERKGAITSDDAPWVRCSGIGSTSVMLLFWR